MGLPDMLQQGLRACRTRFSSTRNIMPRFTPSAASCAAQRRRFPGRQRQRDTAVRSSQLLSQDAYNRLLPSLSETQISAQKPFHNRDGELCTSRRRPKHWQHLQEFSPASYFGAHIYV